MSSENFEQAFQRTILQLQLSEGTTLVAVSGGIDSVVLLDLCYHAGLDIAVAHCNYQLRGQDSEDDLLFVKDLANSYGLPFHQHIVDLRQKITQQNSSSNVQAEARKIRYHFMRAVAKEHNYLRIATAHHQQDKVETFLINMMRGSGLAGLVALDATNGDLVRPLLFATKLEIQQYAQEKKLAWREDKSNASTNYLRNKLRHKVIPVLEEIQPNFQNRWTENIQQLKMAQDWLDDCHQQWVEKAITATDEGSQIAASELKPQNLYPLFHYLTQFGFNIQQTKEIVTSFSDRAYQKRQWKSNTHSAVQERTLLDISPIKPELPHNSLLLQDQEGTFTFEGLSFQLTTLETKIDLLETQNAIYLPSALFEKDLVLRHRNTGDFIEPEGMSGTQKLKKYLINEKYSSAQKAQQIVLADGPEILWVIGRRKSRKVATPTKDAKSLILLP